MELNWKLKHAVSGQILNFGTKGSVQEALIQAKLLPDPFVEQNEDKFTWIENHSWFVFTEFFIDESKYNQHIQLDFPSVDTYAKIYVNDKLVGETENAFVHYVFDINQAVKMGRNKVRVEFTPPVMYQKNRMKEVGVTLPAPNDVGKMQVAPYCRKPQYQFGWDWSLRMLTMGFWEPASLMIFPDNRLFSHNIKTLSVDSEEAQLEFETQLAIKNSTLYTWESSLFGTVNIQAENGKLKRKVIIGSPNLWWPRGQGDPFLYSDTWVIKNQKGEIIATKQISFGVKKVELIQAKDEWGTSFQIKVNDRLIFCKGADYIPDDIFPARVTDEKLRSQVETMLASNFNMVRIWGGGFYPRESFLTACDEGGLMVWEDFMFACAMYPGNESFLKNVTTEIKQQTQRIGSHACLTYFNGNNEVDVAWKNWGFQSTYKLTEKDNLLIESYYQRLFKELIPQIVSENTPIPYEHTSPLSNWGKDEYYNHGTQHYWGVWHGKDPIEDFSKKFGRFNAEYGFQSFPEMSTIASFSKPSDWQLNSPVMKKRQKSYVGNQMIAKHSDLLYGKTNDFNQFIYFSQLTQAKAVGMAISSHRKNFPRCTGTLYWQFNDCWPAISWSSVDYYRNWKALQYQVKKDFEDVGVLEYIDSTNHSHFILVSDIPNGYLCEIKATVFNPKGELLEEFHCKQALVYPNSSYLFENELAFYENQNMVVVFEWKNTEGKWLSRTFTRFPFSISKSSSNPKVSVQSFDSSNNTGVVSVENQELLVDFWLTSKSGYLHLDSNFETLLPGIHLIPFKCNSKQTLESLVWYFR